MMVTKHVRQPIIEIALCRLHFRGKHRGSDLDCRKSGLEHGIRRRLPQIHVPLYVAESDYPEFPVLEILHASIESFRRSVTPGMRQVRNTVILQHHDLAVFCLVHHLLKERYGPGGIGDTRGRDDQRMMPAWI